MRTSRPVRVLLSCGIGALVCLLSPTGAVAAGRAGPFDFDGDGFADLAVGSQGEGVGGHGFAGAVSVLPGSSAGPTAAGDQFWSQDSSGIKGRADFGDIFGAVVASGDFDGDGYADLAAGARQKTVDGLVEAGAVSVLYGSAEGLSARRDQLWSQSSRGVPGSAEAGDRFGASLATGDLDGDGFDDLAIGVPDEGIGSTGDGGGMVDVLYGSASGLGGTGAQAWTQDSPGVLGATAFDERFGRALAMGDVNGDGFADLAIGVPQDDEHTGAVQLLLGGKDGLTAQGNQLWSQDSPGVLDRAEGGDEFGSALAMGDVNHDGRSDLAVGVPFEVVQDCEECDAQGAVQVLLGSSDGLTATGNTFFHVGSPGLPGRATDANELGDALTAGDFDGDGSADLAVTAPGADVNHRSGAGAVYVLLGSPQGLQSKGLLVTQDTPGVPGSAESGDGFAMSVAAHRYAGGTRDSLAIGFPGEDVGAVDSAGAVVIVPGSASGLDPASSRRWSQDSPGVRGKAEELDQFGHVGDDEQ